MPTTALPFPRTADICLLSRAPPTVKTHLALSPFFRHRLDLTYLLLPPPAGKTGCDNIPRSICDMHQSLRAILDWEEGAGWPKARLLGTQGSSCLGQAEAKPGHWVPWVPTARLQLDSAFHDPRL